VHAIRVVTEAVKEVQEAAALAVNIAHNVDGPIEQLADQEHPLSPPRSIITSASILDFKDSTCEEMSKRHKSGCGRICMTSPALLLGLDDMPLHTTFAEQPFTIFSIDCFARELQCSADAV